jgi:hypothetical protein
LGIGVFAADDADERGSEKEFGTEGREGRKEDEKYDSEFIQWLTEYQVLST